MQRPAAFLLFAALGCGSRTAGVCSTEGFDAIDAARWTLMDPTHTDVTAAGGQLVIAPPAAVDTIDGLRGTTAYDLTGGYLEIAIAQYLTPAEASQDVFAVFLDANNELYFGASYMTLSLRKKVAGVDDANPPAVTFDPSVRYWRFAHDESTNTIRYETSVDHATWQTALSVAPPFAIDALHVQLEVDTYNGGVAVPGEFAIDSVVFASPGCSESDHDLGLPP